MGCDYDAISREHKRRYGTHGLRRPEIRRFQDGIEDVRVGYGPDDTVLTGSLRLRLCSRRALRLTLPACRGTIGTGGPFCGTGAWLERCTWWNG
jgi:hypothetical protein